MRIMVVGGGGLLGQKLVEVIEEETDWEIVSVVRGGLVDIEGFHPFDTTSKRVWKELITKPEWRPDVIINSAALTNVDACESDRKRAWQTNVGLVEIITEVARKVDASLVHISSDYIFDGTAGPYDEEATPNPLNYYGRTKLAAENVCLRSGVQHTIVRTMWLYGVAGGGKRTFVEWVLENLTGEQPINIVTDEIGTPTLTDDVAYGIVKIIEKKAEGIFNLSGSDLMSRWEFAKVIAETYDLASAGIGKITTADLPRRAQRPLRSGLVNLKAGTYLGMKATSTKAGLHAFLIQRERMIGRMPLRSLKRR